MIRDKKWLKVKHYEKIIMNQVIILAAGKGTRMQSDLPKTLHLAKGVPIIKRLLNNIKYLFSDPAIVVGYRSNEIVSVLGDKYLYIHQDEQLGTGHALMCAKKVLAKKEYTNIIVIPGDHPLISEKTLRDLLVLHESEKAKLSLAVVSVPNFKGDFTSFFNCGRIMRNAKGEIIGIVECKDASEEQKKIREVNTSYYCFDTRWLWENIDKLENKNVAKEYYLTDMVKIACEQGEKISSFIIENAFEGLGVNNKEQLEKVESHC